MVFRGHCFYFLLVEKSLTFWAWIIPEKWQTSTFKDVKFRHDVLTNEHEFGLNIVFSNYVMVAMFMVLCFPVALLIQIQLIKWGINYDFIFLLLLASTYFVVNPICENLFVESKYRRRFNEFKKKSKSWKLLWAFISFVSMAASFGGSLYLFVSLLGYKDQLVG